jgi:protocatechuate 3,4-dioxygenase beta subunit
MSDNQFPPTGPRLVPPTEPTTPATDPEPHPPARATKIIGRRTALALLATGGAAAALLAAIRQGGGGTSTLAASSDSTATTAGASGATASSGAGSAATSTTAAAGAGATATTGKATTGTTAKSASTTTTAEPATTSSSTGAATTVTSVGRIPEETAGPYPGDGTNGPNALTQSGIVRSDIRRSVGSGSATADGVPLSIELTIVGADSGKVLPGAAVYLWHCDRIGRYSMYSSGLGSENYLRGVQVADANGVLRFTSVFPGAYDGRWPHIHFHVFDSASQATTGRNARVTSQLALPESVCHQVYATSGYESSARNLSRSSLTSDMVFRDGADLQLATMSGSPSAGYVARLTVGV